MLKGKRIMMEALGAQMKEFNYQVIWKEQVY